ncbi:MAG: amidohydrolase family protein [Chloroflexota bacterium]
MAMQILDIHTHLGDLLYPQGGSLIERTGVQKKRDFLDLLERNHWPDWPLLYRFPFNKFTHRLTIRAGSNRNAAATRENMMVEMAKYGIDYTVTLPVYPRVSFSDLHAAYRKDDHILPFTGVDFDDLSGMPGKLRADVEHGARGMKLHPILQRVNFDDVRMYDVVEAFSIYELPILVHAGFAFYYLSKEEQILEKPEFGDMIPLEQLVRDFPRTRFIIGHAGLGEYQMVLERFAQLPNIYVDTSFQPAHVIEQLIDVLGVNRVLYGSDWPWGGMQVALECVEKACKGDRYKEEAILFENGANLIRLGELKKMKAQKEEGF